MICYLLYCYIMLLMCVKYENESNEMKMKWKIPNLYGNSLCHSPGLKCSHFCHAKWIFNLDSNLCWLVFIIIIVFVCFCGNNNSCGFEKDLLSFHKPHTYGFVPEKCAYRLILLIVCIQHHTIWNSTPSWIIPLLYD